jgi:hypothetical protein
MVWAGWAQELAKGLGQLTSTPSVQLTNILVQLKTIKIRIVTVRCKKYTGKGHRADIIQDFINRRQKERTTEFLKKKYEPGSMGFPEPNIDYCCWSGSTESHPVNDLAK